MSDNTRTALITGAATGIGRALAVKLAREGWLVFAGTHRTSADFPNDVAGRLLPLTLDVASASSVDGATRRVGEAVGPAGLALLVNNAACTSAHGPLEFIDEQSFKALMEVNFWGPLRMTQRFLPLLRRHSRPRIIIVTSAAVHLTIPMGSAYPVSKCALAALARHLRLELAAFGIEVTALEPGGVKTPMTSFDPSEEVAAWRSIPEPMREAYRSSFAYPGGVMEGNFKFESPERFAERVHHTIIGAARWRPVYTLGKSVALLPLLRFMPAAMAEAVFKLLFKVKRATAAPAGEPQGMTTVIGPASSPPGPWAVSS